MKNKFINEKSKKDCIKKILNVFEDDNEVISASIVGSISQKNNLTFNDIDLVIIYKNKFNENKINALKKLDFRKKLINKINRIKINQTFGPTKDLNKNVINIHLMVYNIKQHYSHVIQSPFTCLDWELSNYYIGERLVNIFPVGKIQFNELLKSRRSINEYKKSLNGKYITISKYNKKSQKLVFLSKKIKQNEFNLYCKHIIKYLSINILKFLYQENFYVNNHRIVRFIKNELGITDENIISVYKDILFEKQNSINFKNETLNFIYKIELLILRIKNSKKLNFMRHDETVKKNIFMGIKNYDIKYKNILNKAKVDTIYCSNLRRTYQTAKRYFNYKNLITSEMLNEIDYGTIEGLSLKKIKKTYPKIIDNWKKNPTTKYPNGESILNVRHRLNRFLKNPNKFINFNTVIITHNNIIRLLVIEFLGLKKNFFELTIPHLSKYQIIIFEGKYLPNLNRKFIYKNLS